MFLIALQSYIRKKNRFIPSRPKRPLLHLVVEIHLKMRPNVWSKVVAELPLKSQPHKESCGVNWERVGTKELNGDLDGFDESKNLNLSIPLNISSQEKQHFLPGQIFVLLLETLQ